MSPSSSEGALLISERSASLPCGLTSLDFFEDEFKGRGTVMTPFCSGYITPHPMALLGMKATPDSVVLIVYCREYQTLMPQWADGPINLAIAYLLRFMHVIEPGIILCTARESQALSGVRSHPLPEWSWDS